MLVVPRIEKGDFALHASGDGHLLWELSGLAER